MTHPPEVIAELGKNQEAYEAVKNEMEAEHWGKTVLIHNGEIMAVHNDEGDAYEIGREKYELGNFSLHLVGERPIDLGFHAISLKHRC